MTIKVLVVDDSAFMRLLIADSVAEDSEIEVVGTARDGLDALKKIEKLKPDVVTMDVQMPNMSGLEALKRIMEEHPLPVIMFSSLTAAGAKESIEALDYGAFDFLPKPQDRSRVAELKEELTIKIKSAASASVRNLVHKKDKQAPVFTKAVEKTDSMVQQIVAIGSSTGGPMALDEVLGGLPFDFPCPLLIVQHMPPHFTRHLAERLNKVMTISVVEAEQGQILENGKAYIAPGGLHMEVVFRSGHYQVALNEAPKRNEVRPSVDTLFESVRKLDVPKKHFVILTGMGSDGAKEMLAAKQAGATTTIAESKETCVVFGMPKSAIELGCVDQVLPLHRISEAILKAVRYGKESV